MKYKALSQRQLQVLSEVDEVAKVALKYGMMYKEIDNLFPIEPYERAWIGYDWRNRGISNDAKERNIKEATAELNEYTDYLVVPDADGLAVYD